MAQLIIRNIDDDAVERIKALAKAEGKSTEAWLRTLVEREARASLEKAVEALDRLRAMTPKPLTDSSVEIIRELRDSDAGH